MEATPKRGWREVADDLDDAIRRGRWQPGDLLPTYDQLAADYRIGGRHLVQKIYDELKARGLVVARRGSGVYVREYRPLVWRPAEMEHPDHRLDTTETADAWSAHVIAQGRRPEPEPTVKVFVEPASQEIAEALQVDLGAQVLTRVRFRNVDGKPIQRSAFTVPWWLCETPNGAILDRTENVVVPGGILAYLGYPQTFGVEQISSRMPTGDEVKELVLPPGTPVLIHTVVGYCADGRPIRFTRTVSRDTIIEYEVRV